MNGNHIMQQSCNKNGFWNNGAKPNTKILIHENNATDSIPAQSVVDVIHDMAKEIGKHVESEFIAKGEAAGMYKGATINAIELIKKSTGIIDESIAEKKKAIEELRMTAMTINTEVIKIETGVKKLQSFDIQKIAKDLDALRVILENKTIQKFLTTYHE